MHPPLACTVRACGTPLSRAGAQLVCAAGHSFDVARRGYANLLQPQDRRSRTAGDSKDAVAARARLLEAGIGRGVLDAIVALAHRLAPSAPARGTPLTDAALVAADLGCGSGELLGALAASFELCAVGIDLSTSAAEAAARRFPSLTWVVANVDRGLPLLDGSVHLLTSLNGRRNADECARVLRPDGTLIVAVPAPDDLTELRAQVQGTAVTRDRADGVVAEHARRFAVADRFTVRAHHRLEPHALRDLLRATYRGARLSAAARVDALERLEGLEVTSSTDVIVLRPGGAR